MANKVYKNMFTINIVPCVSLSFDPPCNKLEITDVTAPQNR